MTVSGSVSELSFVLLPEVLPRRPFTGDLLAGVKLSVVLVELPFCRATLPDVRDFMMVPARAD